jgi:hypothetical protein
MARIKSDPFEPTPVSKMIAMAASSSVNNPGSYPPPIMNAPPSHAPSSAGVPSTSSGAPRQVLSSSSHVPSSSAIAFSSGSSGRPTSSQQQQQQQQQAPQGHDPRSTQELQRKQKEKFLIFTRVLMKYLEQKDPTLHLQVKDIIRDCAQRNSRKEIGYESVTAAMKRRLKEVVNDTYWKRAEVYLEHFLKEKQEGKSSGGRGQPSSSGSARSTAPVAGSSDSSSSTTVRHSNVNASASASSSSHIPPAQKPPSSSSSSQQQPANTSASASVASSSSSRPSSMPPPEGRGNDDPPSKKASRSRPSSSASTKKDKEAAAAATAAKTANSHTTTTATSTPTAPTTPSGGGGGGGNSDEVLKAVDYALPYDGSVMGDTMHTMLTAEQASLLYDVPPVINAPAAFPLSNWHQRNVVLVRVAFVRAGRATSSWVNEDVAARDDLTLAVLSEGAQLYLKSVLEKALHAARQRQNLDALRLWHVQHSSQPSAIGIRLGCDVNRQLALAQANDTLTVKRMEEALERRSRPATGSGGEPNGISDDDGVTDEVFLNATSMADLALRPKLGSIIPTLETSAKRNMDVYLNGSREPPFGRVPKVARIELVDFQAGMQFVLPGNRHQKAGTHSSSFFF